MKQDTKHIAELLGITAVVLSLVFVGVQLMLDRRIAESERFEAKSESRMANVRSLLESDAYMQRLGKLWEKGERPSWWNTDLEKSHAETDLSGIDEWAEILQLQMSLELFDSLYFQYEQGLISELYWTGARNTLKRQLADPMDRAFFLGTPRPLTAVVRTLIEERAIE